MAKAKALPKPPPTIETLAEPDEVFTVYGKPYISFRREAPSAVNFISLFRYRVTIERVEESVELLRARLIELFETSERNGHHWQGFKDHATALGIELDYGRNGVRHKRAR